MDSLSLLLAFLLLLLILTTTLYYYSHNRNNKPSPPSKSLKSYPIIGTVHHIIANSHRLVDWSADLLLSSPTGTVVASPLVFTLNPSNVDHIARANFDNYPKAASFSAAFRDYLGRGIVNLLGGPSWRRQRRSAGHVFGAAASRAFLLDNLRRVIRQRLLPLLTSAGRDARVLDLQEVLERLAFDNICGVVLDYDPDCLVGGGGEGERLFRAFEDAGSLSVERAKSPFSAAWKFKKLLNIGDERRLREATETIDEFVERCIRSKEVINGGEGKDFLSQLAQSDDLRDNLINFVLAGRDTMPSALTWLFWLLSSRPETVDKIRDEIGRVRASHEQILDHLRDMDYLHAAITESMRLYPPVSMIARECRSQDRLPDGTVVKKGWMVMYNTLAMGRAKSIWGEDCMEFRPERWLVDGVFRGKNQSEYAVFHAGPRVCLGKDIAYLQMKAVAASILEGFEVEVVEKRGKHLVSMVLKMEGGLPVRIKKRNGGQ